MSGSITVIGPGRMGLTLTSALARSGAFDGVSVFGRRPEHPDHPVFDDPTVRYVFGLEPVDRDCEAVFLAVPDAAVPELAFAVAGHGPAPEGCAAFHLSGALPTDVLAPLHAQGYGVGSFQPLIVVGDVARSAERFIDAAIAVTAAPETLRVAWRVADALGADILAVPAFRRPLFDAAVTLAADALVPVLARSVRLMVQAGIDEDEAVRGLVTLVRTMLAAVEAGGAAAGASGPLVRGDVEGAALHLRALEPEDRRFYALVGREILRLAEEKPVPRSLTPEAREEMAGLLRRYAELEASGAGVGS